MLSDKQLIERKLMDSERLRQEMIDANKKLKEEIHELKGSLTETQNEKEKSETYNKELE